ncbi:hypothetical protein [Rivularia sp. UHCC 0363]|uniref:hypothetical protein n=1 Tax=Rivularia sp. UHCC 0363 TaxID=3110244 RepID=UPI002B1F6530|nr:hypothetical protein [Rivularia sp. UHCC 0363]MEA5599302.1 hypothetical protein [Rivularia sp. UHCC 0363]
MDPIRVTELHDPHRRQGGTGYLIRDSLILTAHHVIAPSGERGILGKRYHMRLIGDYEEGRTDWIVEGCYLCWDSPKYDLALLRIEKGKSCFALNQQKITCFGELVNTQIQASGIGFPIVQEINGFQNPEELQGLLSKYSGLKLGQLRLQVTSPIPNSPQQWQGISGTALFVNRFLVGIVIETNKSFAEKVLWVTPISAVAKDPDFCELVLGDRSLSLSLTIIRNTKAFIPDALLIDPKQKLDAWRRFFEPIELVGRDTELKRLGDFIQRPEAFVWQVLYGQHGVGKSRLAKEWLIQLQSQNPQWIVGFAPDEVSELYQLVNYCPSQATALVVDNAENFGDELWAFLYRVYLSWKDFGVKIRILLLAHTDLKPLSTNFERDQILKELRESRLEEVKEVGTQLQSVKATKPTSFLGISLYPLQDQKQQKRLLDSSGNNSISESEAKKLIDDTRGIPAFLGLAGRYPQTWNEKLRDYARVIVEQAKRLFGEKDCVCVLAVSTLIAPIDSSVLERVVPNAWSGKKMEQLFGTNRSILKKEVPVFEPDLLGQEIVFQSLSTLSDSSAKSLCLKIAQERPGAFLQKTIEIWQRHVDPQGVADKFGSNLGSSAAQKASILDTLFNVATQIAVNSIELPLGHLSRVRVKAYAIALLNPSLPKNQYSKLVDSALVQHSVDSVGAYLLSLHSEAPCNASNRFKWAALLHFYCGSPSNEIPSEIDTVKLVNNTLNDSFITAVLEGLRSPDMFERSFAAYRIAGAMWSYRQKSTVEPIPYFGGVLYGLSCMLQKPSTAERIAAAFAVSRIAREPDGNPGWRHFQDVNIDDRLLAIAKEHHVENTTLVAVGTALRDLWRSSYQLERLLSLCDTETQVLSDEFTCKQENKREEISYVLSFALRQNSVKNYDSFRIAFDCLRLDCFNSKTINHLVWGLLSPVISRQEKIEIIVRTSYQSGKFVIPFLQQAAMLEDEQLQAISIACLVQRHAANEIANLEAKGFVESLNISLADLRNEVRHHKHGRLWNEPNVLKLRERIRDIYVANNGHNIHKLKAKDSTGRWAYYFVLIKSEKEEEFMAALDSTENIDLEDYGQVIASNYGEQPSEDIRDFLKKKYNFDV